MFQLNPTLLNTSSLNLEVVGNNITNSGVSGYKSSDFESALAGAVRSSQGAQIKGAKINMSQGSIVASVSPLSMAINGAGFFKVEKIDGSYTYTRDGSFQMDKLGFIINANGDKLIGFPDAATNAQGVLQIDTAKNPPEVSTLAKIEMNLPAEETQISNAITFDSSDTTSFNNTTSSIVYDPVGVAKVIQTYYRYEEAKIKTASITTGSASITVPTANLAGLKVGQRVTASSGIPVNTYIVSINTNTGAVGISNLATETAASKTITVPTHWEAYIYSNSQEIAKLNFVFNEDGTINKNDTHVASTSYSKELDLATPLPVVAAVWDVAKGQLKFDIPKGSGEAIVGLPMDFSDVTKYAGDFTASSTQTGGYPPGALLGISVERDGKILARYGNGQQQVQAQVMLANFKNPNGLEVARDNQFLSTLASGVEDAGAPGQYGTGAIEGSSVEQSNVDLTGEMIKLIAAQRNYQAVAQLIKKQDEVLQTAINIGQ
jgi:flagellar hook protein FlgE